MPAADDLKTHATTTIDYYELLSVTPTFNQKELDRAWRRTALKYHPDKVGASDEAAREKFHSANLGYEILSDPALRTLYDNARRARERKAHQSAQYEAGRRKAKDELERRERGAKRSASNAFGGEDEEKLEREIRRLAEDGRRRRQEREEVLRQELLKQEIEEHGARLDMKEEHREKSVLASRKNTSVVQELDRTVKARFLRNPSDNLLDPELLQTLFSTFGLIENTFLLKDKYVRIGTRREKRLVGTGVVVFHSVVGAHAAVNGWAGSKLAALSTKGEDSVVHLKHWTVFEDVQWAAGQEPDCVKAWSDPRSVISATNHDTFLSTDPEGGADWSSSQPATMESSSKQRESRNSSTVRIVPPVASFPQTRTPVQMSSPFVGEAGSPSLEEQTLLRLRNAEKKRLESEAEKATQQPQA